MSSCLNLAARWSKPKPGWLGGQRRGAQVLGGDVRDRGRQDHQQVLPVDQGDLVMIIMSTRSICLTGRRRELEQREHPVPSDGHDQEGHSCSQVVLTK